MPRDELDVQKVGHAPVLTPSEAADRLGIGAAMLRRHSAAYEQIHGALPRDERGARSYPVNVIQRLQQASDLYRSGEASSVAEGLERLRDARSGATAPAAIVEASDDRLMRQLLTEIQVMNAERDRVGDLVNALTGDESIVTLQQRVMDLQAEVRDLERRNRALVQELERREAQPEVRRRPWWRGGDS